ncbi:MAG: hypothetical protein EZS28_012231 [Streblomastix strix]|uniref:Uncharacterized protein n=1 Tax=Streblomastix strix TaxID=222440 RepID=A0A5J4WD13_9EUKA|nr:MAG: hypothetical protein EZS28_012231 [Streblomastix strix]
MRANCIEAILEDYNYYTSKELPQRISDKLLQLYDLKKFNDEIIQLEDDNEQEKPVKTRNITGKAINIADCPYIAIVDIDTDKKLNEDERNLIRNELFAKIQQSELNIALVKTGHWEKETTLFKLFSSVNVMKAIGDVDLQWINEAYNKISQIQGLTIQARSNFDRTRIRLAERSCTPHYIEKLVRLTNEDNWVFVVLNELITFSSSIGHEVDKLKSLITDPTLEIRTKFSSSRILFNQIKMRDDTNNVLISSQSFHALQPTISIIPLVRSFNSLGNSLLIFISPRVGIHILGGPEVRQGDTGITNHYPVSEGDEDNNWLPPSLLISPLY